MPLSILLPPTFEQDAQAAVVKKTDAKDGMKKRGAQVHISPSSPAMGTRSKVQTSPSSPAMGTRSKKRLNLA